MVNQELVKAGATFIGKSGEVRHVILAHKPGNGYSVTWDSIPRSNPAYYDWDNRKLRPNGHLTMRQFQKWAISAHIASP